MLPSTASMSFLLDDCFIWIVSIGVHLISTLADLLPLAQVVHMGDPLPGLALRLHHNLLDLRVGRGDKQLAAEEADTSQNLGQCIKNTNTEDSRQYHLDALGHEAWVKDWLGKVNVAKVSGALGHIPSACLTPVLKFNQSFYQ